MSEYITQKLVDRMITIKIVDSQQREEYLYTVQLLIEKIVGFLAIYLLAFFSGKIIETTLFLLPYITLRKYTGGYHCKTSLMCIIMSAAIATFTTLIEIEFFINNLAVAFFLFILAVIFIIKVRTVNHPDMNWSVEEYDRIKILSLRSIVVWVAVIFIFKLLCVPIKVIVCFLTGIINTSLFMVIAKILKQEVKLYD